jgi:hypothetical protein
LNFTPTGLSKWPAAWKSSELSVAPEAGNSRLVRPIPIWLAKLWNTLTSALDDDLNTARAPGSHFDMVPKPTSRSDSGQMKKDDVVPLLSALDRLTKSLRSCGMTMHAR